jgi:hypothetical protein
MMSGRFSPIQSPKRRSADDSSSRYSTDDLPPPPAYGSVSGRTAASSRSATYSNLMNFLDDATAQSAAAPPHSARLSEHRDDVSSISTLSPSLAGGSHSHRQYVWDDDGEHDDAPSPALFKPSVPAPYRRVGAASSSVSSSSHSSSLKTNIEELRLKVERMKGELKVKSQAIKELQSELSRLTSARGEGILCAGSDFR